MADTQIWLKTPIPPFIHHPSLFDPAFICFLSSGICLVSVSPSEIISDSSLLPSPMSKRCFSLPLCLSLFLYVPLDLSMITRLPFFPSLHSSVSSASCRQGKTESDVTQSDILKCSASQLWVNPTMTLLKSQVDEVDSPPSAGLTTNQYESRLIAVNSQMRDMTGSRVPTGHGICGIFDK